MQLPIAISTANALPWSAFSAAAIRGLIAFAAENGFARTEVLTTRAATRTLGSAAAYGHLVGSVHEVWNPRETLMRECWRMVKGISQSRGMVPHLHDSLFFQDGERSEDAMLRFSDRFRIPAVVSMIDSPMTRRRYAGTYVALQVHPDLGPSGSHIPLDELAEIIEARGYDVCLDTYHVRRTVRATTRGVTEVSPPMARSGDRSMGGIAKVWEKLGRRVVLIHFQRGDTEELAFLLRNGRLPPTLGELNDILPECAKRDIPLVIELSPPDLAAMIQAGLLRAPSGLPLRAVRLGLARSVMQEAVLRIRDALGSLT